MLHGFHSPSCIGAPYWARRLPVALRIRLINCVRWFLTLLALWFVLRSIDFAAVLALIRRAAPLGLALAGAIVGVQFVILAWRWQVVLRILGSRVNFGYLSVLLGYSAIVGQVLPSSLGGDIARTMMLARLTGMAAAVRSVVCDRLLGLAGLGLLAVAALPVIAGKIGGITPFLTLTLAASGALTAAAMILAFPSFVRGIPWVGRHLSLIAGDLRVTLCSGKDSLVALALGLASNIAGVFLIYALGFAVGAGLRMLDCLVLVPPVLLVSALPISLAGWGVREGALVAAFNLVHADPVSVVAASVMSGLTTPLVGAIVTAASTFAGWRGLLPKEVS